MNMLIIIGVVLIILVAMGVVAGVIISNENQKKRRQIDAIKGRKSGEEKNNQQDLQHKRRAEIAKKLKESSSGKDEDDEKKKKNSLKAMLQQAGMQNVTVKQFMMFSAIFTVIALAICLILGLSPIVMVMVGITAFLGLPRMFLKNRINNRQKKFLEEFPDVLEAMVRLLKAGMPVGEAISMAGKEFTGPVGEEMLMIYDAQSIGVSMPDAVNEAAVRMPITEMQMFATGISIQAQTGASLSEVLMNLSGVIRARFRLKRKVKALSSEAKSSAMIIGALPVVIGGGLFALNPDYIGLLFSTVPGKICMIGSAFWMSCGVMVMKIMINFKI